MTAEWYYAKDKQKVGPVTEEQLKELVRSGQLARTDMVWKQGMAKWMEAGQVEGLFESSPSKTVPPPIPPAPPPLPVAEWHFLKGGKQHGPVTVEQLRASITPTDLVWRAGMPQWVAASTVPGLLATASPSQPVPPAPPAIPAVPKTKPADRASKSSEEILEVLPAAPRVTTNRVTGELNLVGRNGWGTAALHIILDGEEIGTKSWIDGIHHLQFESTVGHHTVTLRNGDSEDDAKEYPVEFRKPGHYTLKFTTGWFLQQFPTGIESSYSPQALAPLPVSSVRNKALCGSWQPIAESHQGVEFTEDGAVVFSDGAAGRFTASGKAPNEVIEMEMVNGQTRHFKIVSLTATQLVIAEGNEARTFRRAGNTVEKRDQDTRAIRTENRAAILDSASPDETAILEEIAQLEKQIEASEKEARTTGDWSRDTELNANLLVLKQKYEEMQKARRKAASAKHEKQKQQGKRPGGSSPSEVGISDPSVAKQVAQRKTAAQWHAKPVEKKSLSEPEHTVFSGDAPCPKCKTVIWVEWQNVTVTMACPKCGFRFDHDEAIAFLSAHNPDDNYKAEEAAAAVEAVDVLERAKALLASHEAATEDAEEEDEVEPDPFDMICPHCLTEYRARLHVGATTRCDNCLEDFVVCKHIGEVSSGVLQGLNPLSWFASEQCPQCHSVAVELGKGERFSPSGSALTYVTPWYYLCKKCRITWQRHRAL